MKAYFHSIDSLDRLRYAHRIGPKKIDQNEPESRQKFDERIISHIIFEVRLFF